MSRLQAAVARLRRRLATGEGGATLAEVLVTLTIIGIAISGVMAGLAAASNASADHRRMVNANLVVRQFAETLKEHVRTGVVDPDTGEMSLTGYVSCASPDEYMYPYVTNPSAKLYDPPAGFNVNIDAIQSQASTTYNVVLVLDKSSSIDEASAVNQVKNAAKAFIDGLATTEAEGGSKRVNLQIVSFGNEAKVETVDATGNPRALSVSNSANVAALKSAVDNVQFGPKPRYLFGFILLNGHELEYTNWEAGMITAIEQFGAFPTGDPPLVVFVTDGEPTLYMDDSNPPKPEDGQNESYYVSQARGHVDDMLIQQWGQIFAVGVGSLDINNLKRITVPVGGNYSTDAHEYPATPWGSAEWTRVTDYAQLSTRLQAVGEDATSDPYSDECQSPDQGAQRITISAFSDDQEDKATLDIIVRKPYVEETP